MLEILDIINDCNVHKIFNCSPKCSLSECYHYRSYEMFAIFSGHEISPDVLYRRYASYITNSDILYTKLLIPDQT
jgi:hypothetical protein